MEKDVSKTVIICITCNQDNCDHSKSYSKLFFSSQLSLHPESSYYREVELSSSEKVILDEDLLTLILLRVPIRKLVCFASVSKLWHSLITAPRFSLHRSNGSYPLRTSGFFFQLNVSKPGVPNAASFVPLDDGPTTSPFRGRPFDFARVPYLSKMRILQSCAGLFLCCCESYDTTRYYIYNPTTNQLLNVPKYLHCDDHCAAVLAFDPSKSPHFKVFICGRLTSPQKHFTSWKQFHIYSSETGIWRPSGQPFTLSRAEMNFDNTVYYNGCVHWISESNLVLQATDGEVRNSCYYFNVDEERRETMPSPPVGLRSCRQVTFYIGETQNHLHLAEVYACDNLLVVYEMRNDYSGWFLKFQVDLSPISQVYPEMMTTPDKVHILSLIRREIFEEDSFLVLHIPGKPRKAIRYNLVDRSFKKIWDFTYPKYLTSQLLWVQRLENPWPWFYPPRKFKALQFIESLIRV